MLFNKIIDVYTEKHTEPINTKFWVTVKSAGTYSYHSALKG
jgi:hypothetical protein